MLTDSAGIGMVAGSGLSVPHTPPALTATHTYIPLYVAPIASPTLPTPPTSRTAMYTLVIVPTHPLDIGTFVHLHSFLYPAGAGWSPGEPIRHPLEDAIITPLSIRGRIAAERACKTHGVELIVESEDPHALIQHAFIYIQCHPDAIPRPDRAALAAQHVPIQPPVQPNSPVNARNRQYKAPRATASSKDQYTVPTTAPPPGPPIVMDLRYARDPSQAHAFAATQPYNIWEPYPKIESHMVPDVSVRSREDAIRNYGVPIVVRPPGARREAGETRSYLESEWNYPGGKWGLQDRCTTEDD